MPRLQAGDSEAIWAELCALEPASLLIDIEPFVAAWRTDEQALLRGLCTQLDRCATIASVREVVFVTNSDRSPASALPSMPFPVSYIAQARKPFLDLSRFEGLEQPLVVIGDQVLTDGLMAWRLNALFLQVPLPARISLAVRAQASLGRIVAALVFRPLVGGSGASGEGGPSL